MTLAQRDAKMMPVSYPDSGPRLKRHAPIVFTGDVFAIIDDGRATPAEYEEAERIIHVEGQKHAGGLGCVVIVPAGAKPPPEAQRNAIEGALTRVAKYVRGLVWVVEGRGFQAAAVRGVLIGLSLYGRRPYPTHVSTQLHDALGWLATKLARDMDAAEMERAVQKIARTRAEYSELSS